MLGYWEDPVKTAEAVDEARWMHTGDLGVMDGDGYIALTGRIKDMVIRGGENIYPREIEEFLYTHPDIVDAQLRRCPLHPVHPDGESAADEASLCTTEGLDSAGTFSGSFRQAWASVIRRCFFN
ncbi:hypothetical protein GCM10011588_17250 [Nocardia jinanensis]|uniref:AMP-dependent synthetase/ligase domain-containing protein n=1 Tax=Nocardia jinanensis TaxID=382504 RepID=A0A917REI4_9NOCA|nr:hypothetical protein GCM10011588_17250 [Nocardia jinanensis]